MLVVGRVSFIIERMTEHHLCKGEASSVAVTVATWHWFVTRQRLVNCTLGSGGAWSFMFPFPLAGALAGECWFVAPCGLARLVAVWRVLLLQPPPFKSRTWLRRPARGLVATACWPRRPLRVGWRVLSLSGRVLLLQLPPFKSRTWLRRAARGLLVTFLAWCLPRGSGPKARGL